MLQRLLEGLSSRLPSQCAVCHHWPSRLLCDACVRTFAQPVSRCQTCALPQTSACGPCAKCQRHRPALDLALAAVSYTFPWAGIVQDFKFHAQTAWARPLALLMRSAPWVEPALEACQWIVPMPLSEQRLRERGFNQALLLARALDRAKTRTQALLRIHNTPAQSSLHRAERWSGLQGAFAINPDIYAQVHGKRVLLVDDVMTTGASLHAAATCLRQAGAAHITGLVFARTE